MIDALASKLSAPSSPWASAAGLFATCIVCLSLAICFGTGKLAPPAPLIRAESFVLLDRDGKHRSSMIVDNANTAAFQVNYPNDVMGLWAHATTDSSSIGLRTSAANGGLMIDATAAKDMPSGVFWYGPKSESWMCLTASAEPSRNNGSASRLVIFNTAGKNRWSLNMVDGYGLSVRLFDDNAYTVWDATRK